MRIPFCLIVLILSPLTALASPQWHSSQLHSIYPLADGAFALSFKTDSAQCTSTETPKYYYVRVGENGVTQDAAEKIYSAALAAGMADKEVQVNFDDATDGCFVNRLYLKF